MSKRLMINDSWVLEREGSFSPSFSGFISGIIGGAKLTDTIKTGLNVARAATDFGDTGFLKPMLDIIQSTLGLELTAKARAKQQRKLTKAQELASKKIDAIEQRQQKKLEEKLREKIGKLDILEKRMVQMEANIGDIENTIGQRLAQQLFSTNMDSLVEALYSVAKERGITNKEILNIIRALPEFEALMYIMNVRKFYRDHTAHSLRVAALGDFLLDKKGLAGGIEGFIMDKLQFTKEEVRTTWWFTGLLHDIGTPLAKLSTSLNWSLINEMTRCYSPLGIDFYPLQISVEHPDLGNRSYLKLLSEGFPKGWQKIISNGLGDTQRIPSSFRYLTRKRKRTEYQPTSSGLDHGVIAAVTLLRSLGSPEDVKEKYSENRPLIEAARAIALHDNIEKLKPLPFEEYPLLFLLAVCDELQEWSRPIPVTTEDSYFTTALQKVTLTDAIFHNIDLELWDIPFMNAHAKSLMKFNFKRIHTEKETKLKGLDCTEQFPETDMLLVDFNKEKSEVIDKWEIKIQSR